MNELMEKYNELKAELAEVKEELHDLQAYKEGLVRDLAQVRRELVKEMHNGN